MLEPITRKIDYDTIVLYGKLTRDDNPIHTDRDFAARTEMGSIIAHGTFSLNLILLSIQKTFGVEVIERAAIDVRFVAPVRENDTVTSGGQLLDAEKSEYEVWVKNQHDEFVIKGTATIPV